MKILRDTAPHSGEAPARKSTITRLLLARFTAAALALVGIANAFAAAPSSRGFDSLPGAIFTTDASGMSTNENIYADKSDVYLNGGPRHPGAAGLEPGVYYVQVTDPSGTIVLGTSIGSGNDTPFIVDATGEPVELYRLSSILIRTSDGLRGFDNTSNAGGEYKVWVSPTPTFDHQVSKTDNFKAPSSPSTEPPLETT